MGGREWLDEFWRVERGGKGGIAVRRRPYVTVMADVGECVLYWLGRWWQRRKQLLYEWFVVGYWSSLSPSLNSWTEYIDFN